MTADVIVLGLGGMGAATAWQLAARGAKVVAFEQFGLAHALGSSHGETRIIRQAYFEHSNYVPLLLRSYELWRQLEELENRKLLHQTGLMLAGPREGEAVAGAIESAKLHGLRLDELTPAVARQRWPALAIREEHAVVFEPAAGYLPVETCVAAMHFAAMFHGADLRPNTKVIRWSSDGRSVEVQTANETLSAGSLVITAGPWAAQVCRSALPVPLEVLRKYVGWFILRSPETSLFAAQNLPPYYVETSNGSFYGFPCLDGASMKVAEHSGGEPVRDPDTVDRTESAKDVARLREFIKHHLPIVGPTTAHHSVCLYTMSPDRHFILDRHPRWPNVSLAAGFSGHGFKFAPIIGEIMASFALGEQVCHPIEFLSLRRFSD